MTESPFQCVLDANVAIKLYINQLSSDKAIALLDLLQADIPAKFYVPEFFYAECANVLWQYVRIASYPPSDARQSLEPTFRRCGGKFFISCEKGGIKSFSV